MIGFNFRMTEIEAAIGRELTKMFEEFRRGPLGELAKQYASEPQPKGELVVMVAPLTLYASPGSSARTRMVALPPDGTVTLLVFVLCHRRVPSLTTSCAGVMVYGPAPLAHDTVTSRALYCAGTRATSNTLPANSVSQPPSAVSRYPPRAISDTTPRRSRRASASATARVRRALPACHAVTGRPSAASVASSASSSPQWTWKTSSNLSSHVWKKR